MPEKYTKIIRLIQICLTIIMFHIVVLFLLGGICIFSEPVSQKSNFQVNIKENINYKIWVIDLNGPERINVKIYKGSFIAFEDTFILMHPEGDYLPYHPAFSVRENGTYQVYVEPMDSGTVRLAIMKSRIPKLL